MEFIFDIKDAQRQYIQITALFKVYQKKTTIFFPNWRPGRYELGNFAKNVNHFAIYDQKGNPLDYQKNSKNSWIVSTENISALKVKYSYYAAELNAGSTFLDKNQLYVNPVNCCLFTEDSSSKEIKVQLNIPDTWDIAHSLPIQNKTFVARNYDELVDSPFICSSQLQSKSYEVDGITFHIWFNGLVRPDWKRIINDFKAFTKAQIQRYGKFPVEEYHFLFQILPSPHYHGVEHCKSTVISLGPSFAIFEELYKELLGVSSHELYHTWNVKSIRDKAMYPYNFKAENYSELGYIAEGVTTYMGDLMLYKSDVFSLTQYLQEMSNQIQKHQDNFGRLNYSVAESSFDTWLDGYVKGAPNRKVSIYTEGCLLAFIIDIYLLKETSNKNSLNDVMQILYENFGSRGIGITEGNYQKAIEEQINSSLQWFFEDYIHGKKDYFPLLKECFNYLGLEIKIKPNSSEISAYWGGKIDKTTHKITDLYPNSTLDLSGAMLGDKIVSINNINIENNADRWASFFREEEKSVGISRNGEMIAISLPKTNTVFYKEYYLEKVKNPTDAQKEGLKAWKES